MPLCLSAGAAVVALALESFTLAWTHSIEKVLWEEDWRVVGHQLILDEARVRGSGAGMEPPASAVLVNGVWRYRPYLPPRTRLALRHSPYAPPYSLCSNGLCRKLTEWFPDPSDDAVLELSGCHSDSAQ